MVTKLIRRLLVRLTWAGLMLIAGNAYSLTVEIVDGAFISGGYVILKTDPRSSVTLLEQTAVADNNGYVALGFGRNVSGIQRVIVVSEKGNQFIQDLTIEGRIYNEQRIEGVNPAKVNPPKELLDRIFAESKLVTSARATTSNVGFWRTEQFVAPIKGRVTGVYGSQRFFNGEPRNPHWGIDYAAAKGSAVKAPAGGVVRLAESDLYFSGGTIVLDHGGGLTSSFLHLSRLLVKVGDEVKQGDVIGEVGSTGRSTGPHLDWRMNLHGERIDAALWLAD